MLHNGKASLIKVWEVLSPVSTPDPSEDTHINSKTHSVWCWVPSFVSALWQTRSSFSSGYLLRFPGRMTILNPFVALKWNWLPILWLCVIIHSPYRLHADFYSTATFPQQSKTGLTVLRSTTLLIKKGLNALFSPASHPISSKYRQPCLRLCSRRFAVS